MLLGSGLRLIARSYAHPFTFERRGNLVSAELGDLTLASNQVLHNFLVFTSFGLDGFAHAAEAILGEAVGRRDRASFQRALRVVFLWSGLVGLLNVAVYAVAGHFTPKLALTMV